VKVKKGKENSIDFLNAKPVLVQQIDCSSQLVKHSKCKTKIGKPLSKPKYQMLFFSESVL